MFILLVAFLAAVQRSQSQLEDPLSPACFGSLDGELLDCSRMNLEEIPAWPDQAERVYLNDNRIQRINPILPPSLTDLDLSNNLFRSVAINSSSLLTLNLAGNPLMSFNLEATQLRTLNASYCSISFLPDRFFEKLPLLEVLDLSGNTRLYAVPSNPLRELYVPRTAIRNLPKMPNLLVLDVSYNTQLLNLQTGEPLKTLLASNCSLHSVVLNPGLLRADLSSNGLHRLKIHNDLTHLDASNNRLSSLEIDNSRLHTASLANNMFTTLHVTSRYLKTIDLSRNPIFELSVHCTECVIDCSYCEIKKVDLTNVKFLNLQHNKISRIVVEGAKDVDLKHNVLNEVSLTADAFDLRYNNLVDPNKVSVLGIGYFANNPWQCKCEGLRKLRQKSKDNQLLCNGLLYETCFTGPKKTSHSAWVTLVAVIILLGALVLVLYFLKLASKGASTPSTNQNVQEANQDTAECLRNQEIAYRTDALPTYEEALQMSKPEWRQSRNNSRRLRAI